jgi:hypothetical protein
MMFVAAEEVMSLRKPTALHSLGRPPNTLEGGENEL